MGTSVVSISPMVIPSQGGIASSKDVVNQPGLKEAATAIVNRNPSFASAVPGAIASLDLPANPTASEVMTAVSNREAALNAESETLKTKEGAVLAAHAAGTLSDVDTISQLNSLNAEQDDLFKGIIVIGLIALWVMAAVMNDAISSTQDSQTLTQKLQESMTVAGLNWSNQYSQALQKQADLITAESNSGDDTNTKSMKINALTSEFNKINSDSQAASSFSSGMTNAVNNSLSSIVQAIQIDMQNVQQGVQKLFDAMAQFN